ncbi:MAG: tRNA pseudouridine(55) synthase TruB [Candidatus Marinamargulisbacteria bacterium]
MNGFLLINKPTGITSYDVIRQLKKILPKKTKIGHSGTLDPFATGLMIIAIGRNYTKQLNTLLNLDKTYLAEITFGIETDSYDIDGNVVKNHSHPLNLTLDNIQSELAAFKGDINQLPPAFSAKKINGTPAYKLARNGHVVELKSNQVSIYDLNIITSDLSEKNTLSLSIHCSKGTYIRSLAHDIGQALGVGGHLSKLLRTRIGSHCVDNAWTLSQLTNDADLSRALINTLDA